MEAQPLLEQSAQGAGWRPPSLGAGLGLAPAGWKPLLEASWGIQASPKALGPALG